MANRVIKDSIWTSKTLAKIKDYPQDQWIRFLLMADDWGCLNVDPDVIKGIAYPKRNETVKQIKELLKVYNDNGMLFLWTDEVGREWGYFTSWDNHNFCNASGVDNEGKYTKHRRKTPAPPVEELKAYSDKFRQVPTKSSYPNPNPVPNPNPKNKPFQKPTLTDLSAYIKEKGYSIDPERFYDFYESKGWMVGRNKMKDWKAGVRNWERMGKEQNNTRKTKQEQADEAFRKRLEEEG